MSLQLAELALHIPVSIPLFEKYGFDYYLNGKQTLRDACKEKGLLFENIESEITGIQKKTTEGYLLTLYDMDIGRLIDFINGQHHDSEAETLELIHSDMKELVSKSNDKQHLLKLSELTNKFGYLKERLLCHCEKEDKLLFPLLKQIVVQRRDKQHQGLAEKLDQIRKIIAVLETEHIQAVNLVNEIKVFVNNFNVPAFEIPEYAKLMSALKEFEYDLHVHLHIENNVLFPKFNELCEELSKKKIL
jgi:regulator of cell morphogenesis and NO signaling